MNCLVCVRVPGSRVYRCGSILKGKDEQPEVIVHIGTMTWEGNGMRQNECGKLSKRLKSRTSMAVIFKLLPVACLVRVGIYRAD